MFGLVSKKKYDELEAKYREIKETKRAEWYADLMDANSYVRLQEKVIDLQKENQSIQEEISHWKQMYADEVQKRVDFCEKQNGN